MRKEAQSIIDRLAKIDYSKNHTNEKVIENAFRKHLEALKQPYRPVVLYNNMKSGYAALDAAWNAAWDAAWDAARDAAWDAAWNAAWDAARGAALGAAWDAAWNAARDAALGAALGAARGAARDAAWNAARDAALGAARGAAWDAAIENSLYDHERYAEFKAVWLPFTEATEAGLFVFWLTKDKIIAIEQPIIQLKDNRLHCEDGPAVKWPNEEYYFLNGVKVPEWLVKTPSEKLTLEQFNNETNADVRAEFIRKSGMTKMKSFGKTVDRFDKYNDPWWVKSEYELLDMGEFMSKSGFRKKYCPYLWMKNQTTGVYHLEGIDPKCKTIGEAIDFQLGIDKTEGAYIIGGIK